MEFKTDSVALAYEATGRTQFTMPEIPGLPEADRQYMKSNFDLTVVVDAINQEDNDGKPWDPSLSELKYEIVYFIQEDANDPSGVVLSYSTSLYDRTGTYVGSRLWYQLPAAAKHSVEKLYDLHQAVILKRK